MLQTTIIDLQEEIRTKRFHLKTGPSAKLAQSQYICTRCRDAMAGMVRRLDVLQVGGDRSLAQENPLPVELSHLKGVALEEETVLDVLPGAGPHNYNPTRWSRSPRICDAMHSPSIRWP